MIDRSESKPLTQAELDEKIPVLKPNLDSLNNPPNDSIQVTWIGKIIYT